MSKKDDIIALVGIARDTSRTARERKEALAGADELRKEMKTSWAKLEIEGFDYDETAGYIAEDAEDEMNAETDAANASGDDDFDQGEGPARAAAQAAADEAHEQAATKPAASGDKPKKAPKEKKPVDPNRGLITKLVNELLMDPSLSYQDIVDRVKAAHPDAQTTARSVASVAADLRKEKGVDVPIRRKPAAPKPEKGAKPEAEAETPAADPLGEDDAAQ